ncbi:MAG: thiamine pyrophosphate-dependent enzyme, partial [Luteibaculum sp.]
PTLLDIKTYRYKGHSMSDPQTYRTKEEVEKYKEQDPIGKVQNHLLKEKAITEAELKEIQKEVKKLVDECVKFAEDSPEPKPEDLYEDVYSEPNYPFVRN